MVNKLEKLQKLIYEIREQKVMLDRDLADLYGVELRILNQAVKRNIKRFPFDFMFQLTDEEWKNLRSQIVIFNKDTRPRNHTTALIMRNQRIQFLGVSQFTNYGKVIGIDQFQKMA